MPARIQTSGLVFFAAGCGTSDCGMPGGTVDMDSFPFGMITDKREVMLATCKFIAKSSLVRQPDTHGEKSAGNGRQLNQAPLKDGWTFRGRLDGDRRFRFKGKRLFRR
jgi:hypothetical protein